MSGGFNADREAEFHRWLARHDHAEISKRDLAKDSFYYGRDSETVEKAILAGFVCLIVGFFIGIVVMANR